MRSLNSKKITTSRRSFLVTSSLIAAGVVSQESEAKNVKEKLRDKLWIWTHYEGSHNKDYNIPAPSRMTPAEGALYLGIPNLLFIRYEGKPAVDEFYRYAVSFKPFKKVVWSLVGAGGATGNEERNKVISIAEKFPNICGFVMDDFFKDDGTGALTAEDLGKIRENLVIGGKKKDLYVVVYTHQIDSPIKGLLNYCDKITYWTWHSKDIPDMERNFEKLEKVAPEQGKLLGCYLWDYGDKKPIPLELMKKQCEIGKKLLKEKRAEGIIFLGSNVCDLELETVEWTKKWIEENGNEMI